MLDEMNRVSCFHAALERTHMKFVSRIGAWVLDALALTFQSVSGLHEEVSEIEAICIVAGWHSDYPGRPHGHSHDPLGSSAEEETRAPTKRIICRR